MNEHDRLAARMDTLEEAFRVLAETVEETRRALKQQTELNTEQARINDGVARLLKQLA